jgi:DNA-binding PadR family transcriptional regulator
MRQPEDELLIVLSHGMDGWMLGTETDAVEIATFVNTTGQAGIPKAAAAIEGLLEDMVNAGLVERVSRPPGLELYGAYALTEDGWARARDLEDDGGPTP